MWLFLLFVFLALFIFGLCEFLHLLYLFMIFPKRKMGTTLVVMLDETNAIKQIIFAGEQLRWLGDKYADRVIAVAENLSEEVIERISVLEDIDTIGAMTGGSSLMSLSGGGNTVSMYVILVEDMFRDH